MPSALVISRGSDLNSRLEVKGAQCCSRLLAEKLFCITVMEACVPAIGNVKIDRPGGQSAGCPELDRHQSRKGVGSRRRTRWPQSAGPLVAALALAYKACSGAAVGYSVVWLVDGDLSTGHTA